MVSKDRKIDSDLAITKSHCETKKLLVRLESAVFLSRHLHVQFDDIAIL